MEVSGHLLGSNEFQFRFYEIQERGKVEIKVKKIWKSDLGSSVFIIGMKKFEVNS